MSRSPRSPEPKDAFPVTELQHHMLLQSLLAPNEGTYTIQGRFSIHGPLNVDALVQAKQELFAQRAVFRTSFSVDRFSGAATQRVLPSFRPTLEQRDLRELTPSARNSQLEAWLAQDRATPFDLSAGPPARFRLLRTGADSHEYVCTIHHALMDGHSALTLSLEMQALYDAVIEKRSIALAPRMPFEAYVQWLREQDLERVEPSYREQIGAVTLPSSFRGHHERKLLPDSGPWCGTLHGSLSEELSAELNGLAFRDRMSANSYVHGAWALLLHAHSGARDVLFGTTIRCRNPLADRDSPQRRARASEPLGLFINTVPLPIRVDRNLALSVYLQQVNAQLKCAQTLEHTPASVIRRWSTIPAAVPLFESAVGYLGRTFEKLATANWPGAFSQPPQSSVSLTVELAQQVMLKLSYDRRRLGDAAAEALLAQLQDTLEAMIRAPGASVGDMPQLARSRSARAGFALTTFPVPAFRHEPTSAGDVRLLALWLAFIARMNGETDAFDVNVGWDPEPEAYKLRAPALCASDSLARYDAKLRAALHAAEASTSAAPAVPMAFERVERLTETCPERLSGGLLIQIPKSADCCRIWVCDERPPRVEVERLLQRFGLFLRAAAECSAATTVLSRLPLWAAEEQQRVLVDWNDTQRAYADCCVYQLFERQAAQTPAAPALRFEGSTLTYSQLCQQVAELAGQLRARGIARNDRVALYLTRGPQLVISLLAVMRAGATYVPLDPIYPAERIAHMLSDAQVALLLSERKYECVTKTWAVPLLWVDDQQTQYAGAEPAAQPADLAYVIYTSGSTGRPKGVEVRHSGLSNLLCSLAAELNASERDRWLAVTTVCFDIAGLELYLPLISGGCIELAPAAVASDGFALQSLIEAARPTFMQATPATWKMLLSAGWSGLPTLTALTGREALPHDLAQHLCARVGRLWNLYGPTETTIWSALSVVEAGQSITIGRPLANTQLYVLDELQQPVPPGVPGELYIGGAGVARGYRGQPELTRSRFLQDPCLGHVLRRSNAPLFRTGDRVRALEDGCFEFLGRNDQQIKLHGYRIELGDIEYALRQLAYVREAAVSLREDANGNRWLAAFVVVRDGTVMPAQSSVRKQLLPTLPDYMVPTEVVLVEHLPLTDSGKLDRKQLAAWEHPTARATERLSIFEVERCVDTIWRRVLPDKTFGVQDNFFDAGGNSLLLMQVVLQLRAELDQDVEPADMATHTTIRAMARFIERRRLGVQRSSAAAPPLQQPKERAALAHLRKRRSGS